MNCTTEDLTYCGTNPPKFKRICIIPQKQILGTVYNTDGSVNLTVDPAYNWQSIQSEFAELNMQEQDGLYTSDISIQLNRDDFDAFEYQSIIAGKKNKWFLELTGQNGIVHGLPSCTGSVSFSKNTETNEITLLFNSVTDSNFFFYDIIDDTPVSYTYTLPPKNVTNWQCLSQTTAIQKYVTRSDGKGYYYLTATGLPLGIDWIGWYDNCVTIGTVNTCTPATDIPALPCVPTPTDSLTVSESEVYISSNGGCPASESVLVTSDKAWSYSVSPSTGLTVNRSGNILNISVPNNYSSSTNNYVISVSNGVQTRNVSVSILYIKFNDNTENKTQELPYIGGVSRDFVLKSNLVPNIDIVWVQSANWFTVVKQGIVYRITSTDNNTTSPRSGTVKFIGKNSQTGAYICYFASVTVNQEEYIPPENPSTVDIIGYPDMCFNQRQQLEIIFNNMGASHVTWQSLNTSLQTVDNEGLVTTKATAGNATIRQTTPSGITGDFVIAVKDCEAPPPPTYQINIEGCQTLNLGQNCNYTYTSVCSGTHTFSLDNELCPCATLTNNRITVPATCTNGCSGYLLLTLTPPANCDLYPAMKFININGNIPPTPVYCNKSGKCVTITGEWNVNRPYGSIYHATGNCIDPAQKSEWQWSLTQSDGTVYNTNTPSGSYVKMSTGNRQQQSVYIAPQETQDYLFLKFYRNNYSPANSNYFGCGMITVSNPYTPSPVYTNCETWQNYNRLVCNLDETYTQLSWNVGNHIFNNITSSVPYVYLPPNLYFTTFFNAKNMNIPNRTVDVNFNLCGVQYTRRYTLYSRQIYFVDYQQYLTANMNMTFNFVAQQGWQPMEFVLYSGNNVFQTVTANVNCLQNLHNSQIAGVKYYTVSKFSGSNAYIAFENCTGSGTVRVNFINNAVLPNYFIEYYNNCNNGVLQNKRVNFFTNNVLDRTNSGGNEKYAASGTQYFNSLGQKLQQSVTVNRNEFTVVGNTYRVPVWYNESVTMNWRIYSANGNEYSWYNKTEYLNNYQCKTDGTIVCGNFVPVKSAPNVWYFSNGQQVSNIGNYIPDNVCGGWWSNVTYYNFYGAQELYQYDPSPPSNVVNIRVRLSTELLTYYTTQFFR